MPHGERIKVLDFGVAKLTPAPGDRSHTQTGSVLGTPTYMSPEQCRGGGAVDARADLYALGCVLYELMCGQPPFTAEGIGEMIAHHLYFAPRPPRALDPTIPAAVEQLILWLLQKNPGERPQSARALIEAIDQADIAGTHLPSMQGAAATAPPTRPRKRSPASGSTTLSAASGVTASMQASRSRRWVIPAVAAATVALAITAWLRIRDGGEPAAIAMSPPTLVPPAQPPVSAAPLRSPAAVQPAAALPSPALQPARVDRIHLYIASEPAGATVVIDGKPVGTTPYEEEVVRGSDRRVYELRKTDFEPAQIRFETAQDGAQQVTLKRKRARYKPADIGDKGVNPFD
jgi:serine/threonine-protein kinase